MNVGKLIGGLCVAATAALIGDACACARIRHRIKKYFDADNVREILNAGVEEAFSDPKLEENIEKVIKEEVKEEVERQLKEESPGD